MYEAEASLMSDHSVTKGKTTQSDVAVTCYLSAVHRFSACCVCVVPYWAGNAAAWQYADRSQACWGQSPARPYEQESRPSSTFLAVAYTSWTRSCRRTIGFHLDIVCALGLSWSLGWLVDFVLVFDRLSTCVCG